MAEPVLAKLHAIGPNRTVEPLDPQRERAALLVAEDELPDTKIARRVGIAKSTLELWKKDPAFETRVAAHREQFRQQILSEGFADKAKRVRALNQMAGTLEEQLLASDLKRYETIYDRTGNPMVNEEGDVYRDEFFDKDKFAAFRGALKDIADELGDRKDATPSVNVNFTLAQIVAEYGAHHGDQ